MANHEVEIQLSDYLAQSQQDRVSTEFVDSEGRRYASAGPRSTGKPHDVVVRLCYVDGRKCYVRGRTRAGKDLVRKLQAA